MSDVREYNGTTNKPLYAMFTTALLVVASVVLIVTDNAGEYGPLFVLLIIGNLPGVISAIFAEKASRDIRNGTVTEKSRQGTHQALQEAGVVTREGPVATQTMEALGVQTQALMAVLQEISPKVATEVKHQVEISQNGNDTEDIVNRVDRVPSRE
jgi:hypothetical protein